MKRKIYFALLLTAATGLIAFGVSMPKDKTTGDRLTVPEAWRGTWEVTVSYRVHATGALVATDVTTAAICPGEPIVPSLLGTQLHCAGDANESEMGVSCHAKRSPQPGCNVFVEAGLESQRDGDSWSGNGNWTVKVVGNCEHLNFGEDIVVTGRRVSSAAACDGVPASLIHRFFAHGALVSVLERGN